MTELKCLKCEKVFEQGELRISKGGWSCPHCKGLKFETVIPKKAPYKYDEVNVKYEEGEGND